MKCILPLLIVLLGFFNIQGQTTGVLADSALGLYNIGMVDDARLLINDVLYNEQVGANKADAFVSTIIKNAKKQAKSIGKKQTISDSLKEKEYHNYTGVLNVTARLYIDSGNYEKALPLYLAASENARKVLGNTHIAYLNSINNLGGLYYDMEEYEKALALRIEALEITEKTLGKEHPDYGKAQRKLANVYQSTMEMEKALPLLLESRRNIENTLGKNHADYFETLGDLSFVYKSMSQFDDALPLLKEVLAYEEKKSGKESREYQVMLNWIGTIYVEMGQYNMALPIILENVEHSEKTYGKNHFLYQIYLGHLIGIYQAMNQHEKAYPLILEEIEIVKQIKGKEHFEYALALDNLGRYYVYEGEYEKALPVYLESLAITEKTLGKDHTYYNDALSNLSGIYRHLGQYEKALPLCVEVLKNTENTLGKEHRDYGAGLDNLGGLYEEMGQYDKALDYRMQALKNTEKTLGKKHHGYGICLNNIAGLYLAMRHYTMANNFYNKSFDVYQNFLSDNLFGIDEELKTSLIDDISFICDIQQSLFLAHPDSFINDIGRGWENVSFFKGLALKSGNLLMQQLRSSNDTAIIKTLDELTFCRAFVNNELGKPTELQSPQLAAHQQRAQKAERTLLAYSTTFTRLKQYLFTTNQQIADALTETQATIEFTNFVNYNNGWTDTVHYVAYITKHGQQPQMVSLFTEEELLALLSKSTSSSIAIDKNYAYRGNELLEDDSALFLGLYPLVWQKLEPYLQGKKQLYISPSGLLSKVSFAALQDSSGTYLGQRYQINYQLSLTDLLYKQTSTPPASFLIAGGINYTYNPAADKTVLTDTGNNSTLPRGDFTRSGFSQLPGTLAEVNKLSELINKTNSKISLLRNDSANEANIKDALAQNPSVLHIATHGFYIPPPQDNNSTVETENENNYKLQLDPLYRSGIILAGGNLAWEKGYNPYEKEDGILFAKEVAIMNLSNTQLAVLSACETGLGDVQGTEGVMGLQRALKMAGVQHQIATLWSVPDAETVEFMELFYTSWLEGNLALQDSFNAAQQTMMAKYPQNPYKWGAFVLYN